MDKAKRILFFVPYPLHRAPSQRFRVELFFPLLTEKGFQYRVEYFLGDDTLDVLYRNTSFIKKGLGVIKGFLKRLKAIFFIAPFYDYVFVHREASPIGPPVFEFFVSRILRRKMVYDFDDAIWLKNTVTPNPFVDWIRACWKIKYICKWADKVAAGNDYLCDYAKKYNPRVSLIPTGVDTCRKFLPVAAQQHNKILTIGWTGSHTTMPYLQMIAPVIRKLEEKYRFNFLVISNKKPELDLRSLQFAEWSENTEIMELSKIDIGIMPMFNDAFSEGKCGFKIIQYMAMKIPAVASPVGVNKKIIEDKVNGFLCSDEKEWYDRLALLLENHELRNQFGARGRKKVEQEFSLKANADKFLALFQ